MSTTSPAMRMCRWDRRRIRCAIARCFYLGGRAAAEALAVWMQALLEFRITHGPLFRRILNDRIVEPLKDTAVREIVRRRANMAHEPLGKLSAHSLRSGFVTEAGKQGISLGETM